VQIFSRLLDESVKNLDNESACCLTGANLKKREADAMSALAQNDQLVEKISAAILAAVNPPVSGYDAAGEEHQAAGAHLSLQQIAAMIDHTLLKPDATRAQIVQLCAEARQAGFASVCVNPNWVPLCAQELAGSAVKVCTVIGFPLGANMTEIKVAEAKLAIAQGASEVDMVINIGALKGGETDLVKSDIQAVAEAAHAGGAFLKVILETFFLNDDQKVTACRLSQQAGADFVKTSTGFLGGGATVHDIALMRRTVGSVMGVKASGGVRTYEDAVAMIQAGASRIGASAGLKIIQGPSQPAAGQVAALPKLEKQQVDTLVRQVLDRLA
jgi:deoxyribose-phosphate aldolase